MRGSSASSDGVGVPAGASRLGAAGPDRRWRTGRSTKLRAWPAAVARTRPGRRRPASWSGIGPRTVLCVPVLRDGAPIVLLYASRNGPRPFGAEVIEIATIFASYFGTALENAELYHELRRRATRDPLTGLANRELARQRLDHVLTTARRRSPACSSATSTGSRRSTTGSATRPATNCCSRSARGCRRRCARTTCSPASAATSSSRCSSEIEQPRRRHRGRPAAGGGAQRAVRAGRGAGDASRRASAACSVRAARPRPEHHAARRGRGDVRGEVAGPGVVEVFDDAASHRSLDRLSIRSELLRALDRDEFEVLYQPIVELDTGRPVGFEALLRWTHPERGPIPPDVFIPLAEETGEIVAIGTWVLEQACRQLAEWQRLPGWDGLNLNVNLSAAQLWQRRRDRSGARADAPGRGRTRTTCGSRSPRSSHAGDDVTAVTAESAGHRRPLRAGRLRQLVLEPGLPQAVPGRVPEDRRVLHRRRGRRGHRPQHRAGDPGDGEVTRPRRRRRGHRNAQPNGTR